MNDREWECMEEMQNWCAVYAYAYAKCGQRCYKEANKQEKFLNEKKDGVENWHTGNIPRMLCYNIQVETHKEKK